MGQPVDAGARLPDDSNTVIRGIRVPHTRPKQSLAASVKACIPPSVVDHAGSVHAGVLRVFDRIALDRTWFTVGTTGVVIVGTWRVAGAIVGAAVRSAFVAAPTAIIATAATAAMTTKATVVISTTSAI